MKLGHYIIFGIIALQGIALTRLVITNFSKKYDIYTKYTLIKKRGLPVKILAIITVIYGMFLGMIVPHIPKLNSVLLGD